MTCEMYTARQTEFNKTDIHSLNIAVNKRSQWTPGVNHVPPAVCNYSITLADKTKHKLKCILKVGWFSQSARQVGRRTRDTVITTAEPRY